jgi:hypothetical protein
VALRGKDDDGVPLRLRALIRVGPHVDKAVRAALVADKGEADRATIELRRLAQEREQMVAEFDQIH